MGRNNFERPLSRRMMLFCFFICIAERFSSVHSAN
uniref:Uncharacterized protein n=1 Tax=Manihot esculenta TaxID=3983 RepID=A0A2C9WJ56_MANES